MMTCKELAQQVKDSIKRQVSKAAAKPSLAIITVGNDPASAAYVKGKIRDCEEVGIAPIHIQLPEDVTQATLESKITEAHFASGIILQLPVPKHLNVKSALSCIDPAKDVDGLTATSPFVPCTARGVFEWLKLNTTLSGKHVVIINRSQLVGRPLAKLLLDADATVTVCHSKTTNLLSLMHSADVIVTAVGKPDFLHYMPIRQSTIIVDVGINRVNGKLCGDCAPDVAEHGITVTPVPGGVGLLTRAYLLQNTLEAFYVNS